MSPTATILGESALGSSALKPVALDVLPVGDDGWRVSIQGADRGNPFALLGFVARVGERFEVCVIGRPGAAIEAASLDEAVDVLRPAPYEVEAILSGVRH